MITWWRGWLGFDRQKFDGLAVRGWVERRVEEGRICQGQGRGGQRTPELLTSRLLLLLLLLLLLGRLLRILKAVERRGLGAGGGEYATVGQRRHVADVDARRWRRGHRRRGVRRVEDHTALQHVATVRVLLSLMVTRWTSGGWSAGRALILRFLVMVVPMIPVGRRSCLIVLRCCLLERQIFARQAACKPFIRILNQFLGIFYLNDAGGQ